MRQSTLVFVFNPLGQILLAMKKRGFGVGKWNGAGGKVESGESIREAAVRELYEETNIRITPEALEQRALLHFYFDEKPEWDQTVTVFFTHGYDGTFVETEEMKPQWFDIDRIPYDVMWEDDPIWLPRALAGESVEYQVFFDTDGKMRDVKEVLPITF